MGRPDRTRGVESQDDVLAHYGVKGMKWGVRRSPTQLKGSTPSRPRASDDVKTVDSHRSRIDAGGTRALSNKELKEVVERMNLEQQYAGLAMREPTRIDRGHNSVKKTLSLAKTAQDIYNVVNSPAGKAARKLIFGI